MRGDDIANFARKDPPSFMLRLISPGILDSFRFDVAPRPYNDAVPPPGLPSSPLDPDPAPIGFRRADDA